MASPGSGGAAAREVAALDAADARLEHLSAITEAALAHLDLEELLERLLVRMPLR